MRSVGLVSSIVGCLMLLTACADRKADAAEESLALSERAGTAKREMGAPPAAMPRGMTGGEPSEAGTSVGAERLSAAAAGPPAGFAQCRSCHGVEPGRHGIGPSLHGIVGERAASLPGFNYSAALQQSGIVWDRTALDRWLEAPIRMVPGTRMVVGVRDEEQRRQIIEYLESLK